MRKIRTIVTLAAFACGSLVFAQSVAPLQINLQPLDQRVSDVGLLSNSLRIIQPGLEVPTSFDQVYRVPGSDNQLMRVQGALRAVYPQSQASYTQSPWGVTPVIPAGTVFYIGQTSLDESAQSTDHLPGAALRWDTRISNTRINTRTGPGGPSPEPNARRADHSSAEDAAGHVSPTQRQALEIRVQQLRALFQHHKDASAERDQ